MSACLDIPQPLDAQLYDRVDLELSSDLEQLAALDYRALPISFFAELVRSATGEGQQAIMDAALPGVFGRTGVGWAGFCFLPDMKPPKRSWYERIDSSAISWETGMVEALRSCGTLLVSDANGHITRHCIGVQPEPPIQRCDAGEVERCADAVPSYRLIWTHCAQWVRK